MPKLADLRGYASSVREKTPAFPNSIPAEKLAEVARPNRSPNSIGILLNLISTDIVIHVGQIDYLRGMQLGLEHQDVPACG